MEKSAEAARLVRGTRNQLVIEGFGALLNKAVISWLTSHCAEKRLLVVGQYACKGVGGPLYFELAHAGQAARTGMPSNAAALLTRFVSIPETNSASGLRTTYRRAFAQCFFRRHGPGMAPKLS